MENAVTGRPKTKAPENFEKIVYLYRSGAVTADDAVYLSGMSRATFYRREKELKGITDRKGED